MGFGLTPLLGDRHGFMHPQLKKNKNNLEKHIFATVKINELMAKMKEKLGSI